jgi:CheY-like chemotaxis protein
MAKKILDVGQCGLDHGTIRRFFSKHFDCEITQTHGAEDTMAALNASDFDLVLINRKLDRDYTDGIDIIRQMKADPSTAEVPVMLVTNYDDHQHAAVELGAIRGFGKLEFDQPETLKKVQAVLG